MTWDITRTNARAPMRTNVIMTLGPLGNYGTIVVPDRDVISSVPASWAVIDTRLVHV